MPSVYQDPIPHNYWLGPPPHFAVVSTVERNASPLRRAAAYLGLPVSLASHWLAARAAPTVVRHQIYVIDLAALEGPDTSLALVVEAIDLIAKADPRVLRRMAADTRSITIVQDLGSPARFVAPIRIITLDAAKMRQRSVEQRASYLVHEATHARLYANGAPLPDGESPRLEQICLRRELAFARRIEASAEHMNWLHQRLRVYQSPQGGGQRLT
jgi:hypothetical protein